jgi:hypothetical protein
VLTENPAALSAAGCTLANAGRELCALARLAEEDVDAWTGFPQMLSGAAGDLAAAGAAAGATLVQLPAQPKPFWSHLPVFPCLID